MKEETFSYIWDQIAVKTILNVESRFSDDFKGKYNFEKKDLSKLKKIIHRDYDSIREYLKENYYDTSKSEKNPRNRIDNHKIAACICYSFIRNKVFEFDVVDGMPEEMFVSNYEVAYTVCLGFLYATLIAQYKKAGHQEFAEDLINQGMLLVPTTSPGHDEYHTGRIYTLALNDMYGNTFDLLTFSDMMFWIEFYNRQRIENTLTPIDLFDESVK